MRKRYVISLIIIGILIVVVSLSYAYYTGVLNTDFKEAKIDVTTATLDNVDLTVEGKLTFEDLDILPGHRTVSAIKVTAYGENKIVDYNVIWKGINTLKTPLKFYVYRSKEEIIPAPSISCKQVAKGNPNHREYYEECESSNFESLGDYVAHGTITTTDQESKFTLVENEAIRGTDDGESLYYYVVLEYPNLQQDQYPVDKNGKFEGVVTVEESTNITADITIAKIYKDGEEVDTPPTKDEGYTLDTGKSTCDHNASLEWNPDTYSVTVVPKEAGTSCNLYYKTKE